MNLSGADRKPLLLIVVFLCGWCVIFTGLMLFGWTATWTGLGLPTLSPVFADMRTVQAALETLALGLDPQVENPSDPWNRRMNYPSLWIWIAKIFNFQLETNYLIFVSLTVLGYLFVCGRMLATSGSVWLLPLIFSGGSLLAIERGNNDLVIFSLLYFSAHMSVRFRPMLLVGAVALKLYPLVVLPALVRDKTGLLIFAGLSAILLIVIWPELTLIRSGTPSSENQSYGSASLSVLAAKEFQTAIPTVLISAVLILGAGMIYLTYARGFDVISVRENALGERLFLLGASIYCGTFLLSSNWDYRLIFLILCIPHVLSLAHKSMRYLILICMITAPNQLLLNMVAGAPGFYLNIVAKCVLFSLLVAMILKFLRTDLEAILRQARLKISR